MHFSTDSDARCQREMPTLCSGGMNESSGNFQIASRFGAQRPPATITPLGRWLHITQGLERMFKKKKKDKKKKILSSTSDQPLNKHPLKERVHV